VSYHFVRRRTHRDADAEDLTQQVFADASASLRCDGRLARNLVPLPAD
jgi:DNA-directed RNA polymerase specialized sigma24 family protein